MVGRTNGPYASQTIAGIKQKFILNEYLKVDWINLFMANPFYPQNR